MNARRRVETFGSPKWTMEPSHDRRTCSFDVKVNGEKEEFHINVRFSDSILVPISGSLGRTFSEKDLEAIAKARIEEWVSVGGLNGCPASPLDTMLSIDYQNVPSLIHKAELRGYMG